MVKVNNTSLHRFLVICFLILLFLTPKEPSCQSWFDDSSRWLYEYTNLGGPGVVEIKYASDTIIQGQVCKKLDATLFLLPWGVGPIEEHNYEPKFMYEEDNRIYLLIENQFDTLYDFNADIGDTWIIENPPETTTTEIHELKFELIDKGTLNIDNQELKYIDVNIHYDLTTQWGEEVNIIPQRIVEKIGPLNLYLLPWDLVNGFLDGHEGGSLICYSDNMIEEFVNNAELGCDYILDVNETISPQFRIYPNPVSNKLLIDTDENIEAIQLYDLTGKTIATFGDNIFNLDFRNIENGAYILRVRIGSNTYVRKIIKM